MSNGGVKRCRFAGVIQMPRPPGVISSAELIQLEDWSFAPDIAKTDETPEIIRHVCLMRATRGAGNVGVPRGGGAGIGNTPIDTVDPLRMHEAVDFEYSRIRNRRVARCCRLVTARTGCCIFKQYSACELGIGKHS